MQLIRAHRPRSSCCRSTAVAGVLPDDRADLLYHCYDGGGVTIDGPSLLVRKKFAEKYAVTANYYVDMVSSASIDVVTTASPYKEERTQYGVGFEYLRGKVTYAASFSNSSENDYEADTASLSISQDMFGDLTTVSLCFTRGWDDVSRRGDDTFADQVDRRIYGVDVSQIVTKNLILGLSFETITEEGFLNNPYRSVRYVDADSGRLFLRGGALSAHAHGQCALAARPLVPALSRRDRGRVPLLHRHLGHPRPDRGSFLYASARRGVDLRRPLPLLHAELRRLLLGPVPAPELPELPGARQGARRDDEPHARLRRRLRVQAGRTSIS